jgi:DNA-binding beta-propeller fold protein YncE
MRLVHDARVASEGRCLRGPEATKEITMGIEARHFGALVVRLIVGLALLGWPRVGAAQGTWEVISLRPKFGDSALGQVYSPSALAADAAGNLYVADWGNHRIQKRDAQGNWSLIATKGRGSGQVYSPTALAVDTADNLYVAEYDYNNNDSGRIQKRDAQGNWSVLATGGTAVGQVTRPTSLAVDAAGNLYVAEPYRSRIQRRDAQGNWSKIADFSGALAVDGGGNLYVAHRDGSGGRIQKRDAQGNWSVIATAGSALGQVNFGDYGGGLAVDAAGNLYVADTGNNRVQMYAPRP